MRNYQLTAAIADLEAAPKVDIKGKAYSQVATRVEMFRKHFGHDYAILTEILEAPSPFVRTRASIVDRDDGATIATGLAEENRELGPINKTSAIENCETSAIGRALANFGLHGGEYASAGEVQNAIGQQNNSNGKAKKAAPKKPPAAPKKPLVKKPTIDLMMSDGEVVPCSDPAQFVNELKQRTQADARTWKANEELAGKLVKKHPSWADDIDGIRKIAETATALDAA
jgi:hypothetical protein